MCSVVGWIKLIRVGAGLNWIHLEQKAWFCCRDKYVYISHRTRELYLQVVLLFVFDNWLYRPTLHFLWRCGTTRAMASSFVRFLGHTQRRTIIGRTSLDELSARRRDLYLTTHNRHPSMSPVGFEPTISADERSQIYALRYLQSGAESEQRARAKSKATKSNKCS